MNKLTFEEISAIINSQIFSDNDCDPEHWMHEDVPESPDDIDEEGEFKDEFSKLGKIEMIEQFGGEGDGDDYWAVYHFVDHDVYISFDGWFASHHGSEFSDMSEVRPKIVEKTEWEAV